jgi:hypothetical protein
MTPEDIIKKHTEKPDADYSNSWVKAAMLEYGRLKWDEACEAQKNECNHLYHSTDLESYGFNARYAHKPEFKP